MSDILCIYYSRTGNTRRAVKAIAADLGAEIVAIDDGADRNGWRGRLRAGKDAMRRTTAPLKPFTTQRNIEDYKLVIVGTPVWGGRCSSRASVSCFCVNSSFSLPASQALAAMASSSAASSFSSFATAVSQMVSCRRAAC